MSIVPPKNGASPPVHRGQAELHGKPGLGLPHSPWLPDASRPLSNTPLLAGVGTTVKEHCPVRQGLLMSRPINLLFSAIFGAGQRIRRRVTAAGVLDDPDWDAGTSFGSARWSGAAPVPASRTVTTGSRAIATRTADCGHAKILKSMALRVVGVDTNHLDTC